jgi:hypothetical protein
MNHISKIEEFILERRIAQISANIEISFGFDVITTNHSNNRSNLSNRNFEETTIKNITNTEKAQFIEYFKREISEAIIKGDIQDTTQFVIRSTRLGLSMALIANMESLTYWKLLIKTIFPESEKHKLRVGFKQFIIDK